MTGPCPRGRYRRGAVAGGRASRPPRRRAPGGGSGEREACDSLWRMDQSYPDAGPGTTASLPDAPVRLVRAAGLAQQLRQALQVDIRQVPELPLVALGQRSRDLVEKGEPGIGDAHAD